MKKPLIGMARISLVMVALGLGAAAHAQATSEFGSMHLLQAQENLVRDGSFEAKGLGAFRTEVWSGEANITLTSTRAHTGKKCLQIKGKQASAEVCQTVSVEPDTVYEISFWIFTEALTGRGVTGLRVHSDQFGLPYVSPTLHPNDGQ